ncbi:hypothetical protein BDW02DRAFT_568261 [Decorospora gaudefroyi]|uniref:Uncharacterized protein n=1 Tax=Decorospora gaudefroyi TaxID=184978 RepID=A0A6A5KLJ8_9PLEO|nr:hypothetical protein BDW02DRAFT_568261 [Decorospora gaudefroyi]
MIWSILFRFGLWVGVSDKAVLTVRLMLDYCYAASLKRAPQIRFLCNMTTSSSSGIMNVSSAFLAFLSDQDRFDKKSQREEERSDRNFFPQTR